MLQGSHRLTREPASLRSIESLAARHFRRHEIRRGSFRLAREIGGARLRSRAFRRFCRPTLALVARHLRFPRARPERGALGAGRDLGLWPPEPRLCVAGFRLFLEARVARPQPPGWRLGDLLDRAGRSRQRWQGRTGISAFDRRKDGMMAWDPRSTLKSQGPAAAGDRIFSCISRSGVQKLVYVYRLRRRQRHRLFIASAGPRDIVGIDGRTRAGQGVKDDLPPDRMGNRPNLAPWRPVQHARP